MARSWYCEGRLNTPIHHSTRHRTFWTTPFWSLPTFESALVPHIALFFFFLLFSLYFLEWAPERQNWHPSSSASASAAVWCRARSFPHLISLLGDGEGGRGRKCESVGRNQTTSSWGLQPPLLRPCRLWNYVWLSGDSCVVFVLGCINLHMVILYTYYIQTCQQLHLAYAMRVSGW